MTVYLNALLIEKINFLLFWRHQLLVYCVQNKYNFQEICLKVSAHVEYLHLNYKSVYLQQIIHKLYFFNVSIM